jgi:hypothetical protein
MGKRKPSSPTETKKLPVWRGCHLAAIFNQEQVLVNRCAIAPLAPPTADEPVKEKHQAREEHSQYQAG